jgi:hypothetical protein
MSRLLLMIASIAALGASSRLGAAQASPELTTLLNAGASYVSTYVAKTSGVVLEEQYTLIEIASARMMVPRRISSDVVLINLGGEAIALRDTYAIDTVSTRERTLRISELLTKPTGQGWIAAQEFARQSQIHFAAAIVIRASEPPLALRFLAADHPGALRFRLDGRKKMNGVAVTGLRFEEPTARGRKYSLNTRGNASASGRFWIDPATGAVHQTELWLESPTEVARVTVSYAPDALGLLLPKALSGTFEERQLGAGSDSGFGQYNIRQSIESNAIYSNARLLPIDMSRLSGR